MNYINNNIKREKIEIKKNNINKEIEMNNNEKNNNNKKGKNRYKSHKKTKKFIILIIFKM